MKNPRAVENSRVKKKNLAFSVIVFYNFKCSSSNYKNLRKEQVLLYVFLGHPVFNFKVLFDIKELNKNYDQ